MKTITIMVPCFNEEDNIPDVYRRVVQVMETKLPQYLFELVFVDNKSTDKSRSMIRKLCDGDKRVKAIFNAQNFGQLRSVFHGLTQMRGDAVVQLHADLQNPPELLPQFVEKWEQGANVVIGVIEKSKENPVMYFVRSIYYKLMRHISTVEHIEHFTEFELMDRSFIQTLTIIEEPIPYLKGIVTELGGSIARVYYVQEKRKKGITSANLPMLYDCAMRGIMTYSKTFVRASTFVGCGCMGVSGLLTIWQIIKGILWGFSNGFLVLEILLFLLAGIQLFFIGMVGECVLNVQGLTIKRPRVIEECRLNFDIEPE